MASRAGRKIYTGATDLRNRRVTVHRGPHLKAEFEMDRRGIAAIAMGHELSDACYSLVLEHAMPHAIRIAPRGSTLDYVSSFRADRTTTVIAGMRRQAARLWNVSDHAAAVEWTNDTRVLGRTLDHLNGKSERAHGNDKRQANFARRRRVRSRGSRGLDTAAFMNMFRDLGI